ncbi:MAG: arginase family protein [Clostridiales bacterium]|nr:arginase family protein [Clostridiales bacterium]
MKGFNKNRKLNVFLAVALIVALACPAAYANTGSAAAANDEPTKLAGLKVVELLTSAGAGFIGRNLVANGTYPEALRGTVRPGTDTLRTDYIVTPRELDDYHLAGVYETAGVPVDIAELRLTEAQAAVKHPGTPNYIALAREIAGEVRDGLEGGNGIFVVGSNCVHAVGTAAGMRQAYGNDAKIGIIYLDAHGDVNTRHSTFSGSMGGMDLAPIIGLEQGWWEAAAGEGMKPFDASLHGAGRDLDSGVDVIDGKEAPFGEILNMKEAGTIILTSAEMGDEATFRSKLKELADQVDVLYLHIDADAVDSAFLTNVNTPYPDNVNRVQERGPDIWTMMRNIKIIMETEKVAVINLASIYFGNTYTAAQHATRGFTFLSYPGETTQQASNRASQISIMTGIRMISSAFENWGYMVAPAGAAVPSAPVITDPDGNMEGLKVVELLTSAGAGFIGRNLVNNGTYPEALRGTVRPGTDTLRTDYIVRPRELDDYHQAGIYGKAKVPFEIAELRLTEAAAAAKYPGTPNYIALAREIAGEVRDGVTEGKGVFVVGSNCVHAVGTAAGLRQAYGNDAKIGIIYLDAHGDVNTRHSTFSGSMGGMDLAPIIGLEQGWWEAAAGEGMKPFDASMHGAGRDLDSGVDVINGKEVPFGEMLNMEEAGTIVLTSAELGDEALFRSKLKELADQVDVLYLHIDADAVDSAFLTNVNTPYPDNVNRVQERGPDIWTMMRNIKIIMETDKVAVINLASIYFGNTYSATQQATRGFAFLEYPGETTQQASNRVSQISILTGIRMISSAFDNWANIPGENLFILSAEDESDIDGDVCFTLSVHGAKNVLSVELEFEVDGNMLAGKGVLGLSGFEVIDGVAWKFAGGNAWKGTVTLGLPAGDSQGLSSWETEEIAKFVFAPRAVGDTAMKLIGLKAVGLDGEVTKYLDVIVGVSEAATNIDQRTFSKYDLNRDNKVDALDLGIMLLYCGFDADSPNWGTLVKVNDSRGKGVTASMCDVNEDGVIDMLDLLDLFIHYTK